MNEALKITPEEKRNQIVMTRSGKKKKGVSSEVYAFKSKKEISEMIRVFNKRIEESLPRSRWIPERDKLLFIVGINIGLRVSDLCSIRWDFFFDESGNFRDSYTIQPKKTRAKGKFVTLFFNAAIKNAVESYVENFPIVSYDDYVFKSREGNSHIKETSLYRIVKSAAKEAGIKQNIGSHSLRKTFGYHVWHEAKNPEKALVLLQRAFNHSSTVVTLEYIGIQFTLSSFPTLIVSPLHIIVQSGRILHKYFWFSSVRPLPLMLRHSKFYQFSNTVISSLSSTFNSIIRASLSSCAYDKFTDKY